MKFSATKILSLFAVLIISAHSLTYSADAAVTPVYPLRTGLAVSAYAFMARHLSKKVAGHYMQDVAPTVSEFNKATFNNTLLESVVHPTHPILLQIDMSIVFWTAFKVLLEMRFSGKDYTAAYKASAAEAAGFGLAYAAGMDTLCVAEDVQTAFDIYEKYYTKEQLEKEPYALYTHSGSYVAGHLVAWLSFLIGIKVALKATQDLRLIPSSPTFGKLAAGTLLTAIIFNVGITLSSLTENILFSRLEEFEPFKQCGPCRELFRLGGYMSYWWSDVIPGYNKFSDAIALYNSKHE